MYKMRLIWMFLLYIFGEYFINAIPPNFLMRRFYLKYLFTYKVMLVTRSFYIYAHLYKKYDVFIQIKLISVGINCLQCE